MATTKKPRTTTATAPETPRKRKRIPLHITDTTLRDAHQSLWATRMRTKDILDILEVIDNAGFYSLEVWGGATFDVCMRFLRENPWERLRQIKAMAKKTPLQMLFRGQNVLGYKHYADDLVDRTIALAVENGMDIFRIFDALNDNRNLESAIKSVKRHGAHAQGTISYTISPVHTVEKYVEIAREQVQMGIDSLVIKDMAGILSPIAAERLVSALVAAVDVPIQLHSHATSGMAVATYVEGVRAGAGAIDCAISSMAGFSSQPPVETMLAIFDETDYHASLDIECLRKMCQYFLKLAPKRQPGHHPANTIDPEILIHHIPGGMISNLRSQLAQQDALNRLDEVLAELPRTRADLGYPPLVTPTSQIVGVQSVMNVLAGERYSMVTEETKNYVRGLYGRPPAPIDEKVSKKILGDAEPITCRPADLLQPMLPTATDGIEPGLIRAEEDIISYCMFPEIAIDYFRWRNTPADKRAPIPADIEREEQAPAGKNGSKALLSGSDYRELEHLARKLGDLRLDSIAIRRGTITVSLGRTGIAIQEGTAAAPVATADEPADLPAALPAPASEPAAHTGPTVDAPLSGTFYTSAGPGKPAFVKVGDAVKAGDPVCIVEAMKLFNQIKAPVGGTIVKFLAEHGQAVKKGQPLVALQA